MMEQERIYEWVKDKLEQGYDPEVIKEVLKENGYDPTIVDETLKPREKPAVGMIKKDKGKFPSSFLLLGIVLVVILFGFLFFYFGVSHKVPRAIVKVTNPVVTKENNVSLLLIYVNNPLPKTLHVKNIIFNEKVYENNGTIIRNLNAVWDETVAKSLGHSWNSDILPFTKTLITELGYVRAKQVKTPLKQVLTLTIVTREKVNLTATATLYIR